MTHTLEVPGGILHYDVREAEGTTEPPLLLIGSPMDATGFTGLAERFRDRTVVTYDPRGIGRSERTDGASESTPDLHADDLHRLIDALGGGPVDIFASSGGAVNGLALVAVHPEQVRTLVAHEPPVVQTLPDREQALAAVADIRRTYERDGFGAAMVKFIAVTSMRGGIPADFAELPMQSPAEMGMPAEDDGSRDDALFGQNLITCTHYEPDFEALRAASTRVVLGRRRRIGGRTGPPLRRGRRRTTRHPARGLPQPPRRLHGRRVRHEGRPRRLRRHPARGPGRVGMIRSRH